MSCSIGHRYGLDSALLWLWCRPAATAPIRPLAWEPPYARKGKMTKKKKNPPKNKQTKKQRIKQHGDSRRSSEKVIFILFLQPHLWHTQVPKLRDKSELQLPTYTTAHGNARSLTP